MAGTAPARRHQRCGLRSADPGRLSRLAVVRAPGPERRQNRSQGHQQLPAGNAPSGVLGGLPGDLGDLRPGRSVCGGCDGAAGEPGRIGLRRPDDYRLFAVADLDWLRA